VTIAGDTIMLSDKAREAIGLTTAKVQVSDIHRNVTVNARIEIPWFAQAMITSLVPGKIDKVLVRPGETVTAGQELARVVSVELRRSSYRSSRPKRNSDLARKLVEQRRALEQDGVIAGKVLRSRNLRQEKSAAVKSADRNSAIGLDAAAISHIQTTGQRLSYVSIVNPIDGVIVHADVRVGQAVSATDHLYHVVNPKTLWIVGDVLESDVARRRSVVASFSGLPEKLRPSRSSTVEDGPAAAHARRCCRGAPKARRAGRPGGANCRSSLKSDRLPTDAVITAAPATTAGQRCREMRIAG
jgi:cobalt-zinc-cadmium efflux system membrane fusion protein